MRKYLRLFFLSIILVISLSSIANAKENCKECHYEYDVQPINRAVTCKICHYSAYHNTGVYNPPGSGSWFANAASYTISDITTIHNLHKGSNAPAGMDGCTRCHQAASCKTCHNNVSHEPHGNQSYTGNFADGASYGSKTLTCATSNCHKNYSNIVFPSKASNIICLNCHSDVHNVFRDQGAPVGVTTNSNANPSLSDISINWNYQAGDILRKSLDGINWQTINIGSPPAGSFTYTDIGIQNWTIIYYKIIKADASEQYFPVYPPSSNPHYNYVDNTQLCANCHVTHYAEQAKLLKEQTIEDLCRTCHGLANTGSRYNVDTGEVVVAGSVDAYGKITATSYVSSNAGAFGVPSGGSFYAGNHANTWNGREVTSTHSTNSLVANIAPGNGQSLKLTCTSCHRAHAKKNSYRLLRIPTVEAYAVNTDGTSERVNYIKNMNQGCGCHRQYVTTQNSGHTQTNSAYRHAVGVAIQGPNTSTNITDNTSWSLTTTLPTEYYDDQNRVVGTLTGSAPEQGIVNGAVFCITCHYAHGTTSTGTNQSSVDRNNNSILDDNSTMLKRKNNMDVCENCHKK